MNEQLAKQLEKIGGTTCCPQAIFIKNGKVLLGLRNYTADKWKAISVWITPGGRCDEGEALEKTLRREVMEEINIADFEIVDYIGEAAGAKEGDIVRLFYCTTEQEPARMEPEKFSEWKWVPVEEYISGKPYNYGYNQHVHALVSDFLSTYSHQ